MSGEIAINRRRFMQGAACGLLACTTSPVLAQFAGQRSLSFVHSHTGEELHATYFKNGMYDQGALLKVAYAMRDFHNGAVHTIDPMLLDALFELQLRIGHDKPYQIISAYRSPKTNESMRTKHAAAEHSQHLKGKAVDIRVSGIATKKLRDEALAMNRGGVGYYPSAGFIHVDTGRLRTWNG
jgi:uncharacterized protein YcbK (DUF882 family)